jgi:hypothetical protein
MHRERDPARERAREREKVFGERIVGTIDFSSSCLHGNLPWPESSVVLGADACTYPKCAIGSAFVPELRGNFFATGNCYYTSEVSPFALFLFTSFMSYRQVVSDTTFYFDIVAAQFILQTEQIEYTDKILRQLIHS